MPKSDRRTERTRHAVAAAFVGEVLTRSYEDISVEDIVKRANVGRSTFYMHYKSKDDLLRESISRPSTVLAIIVGGDVTAQMVAPQLAHFHEQRARNGTFFRDPIRKLWVKRLAEMIEPRLTKLARAAHAHPSLPLALIAAQIAESQIALITNWLTQKPNIAAPVIAEALIAMTLAGIRAFLGLSADAPLLIPGEKLRVVRPES
ncbi:MAG TPA: TetR/AcrR family transcriptional regulator [Rhizomicrobium sp.]